MNKVLQIVIAATLSVAVFSVPADAANCDVLSINNTGQGSDNQIVCNVTRNVTVECVNNVYVLDANSQTAVSGDATSQGNTVTNGTTITGNATNTNGQTVAIGASCDQTAAPVTSPTPSPTPVTPGKGSITPAAPKALPNTASSSASSVVIASLVAAAAVVIASRLAVAAYRHFGSK